MPDRGHSEEYVDNWKEGYLAWGTHKRKRRMRTILLCFAVSFPVSQNEYRYFNYAALM